MKRLTILLLFGLCIAHSVKAQVKIGDNPQNIDPASVLELESTDKVLVITRVTTPQMNAIVPLQGAMVYNTDVQGVHYFDGTQWVNIGSGGGGTAGPLTADPIVNDVSTIVITPTATGDNLEVAENSIGTFQIQDGSINGFSDIQPQTIGLDQLADGSVTQDKLSENSVGLFQIDSDNLPVSAFNNDAGYITGANIVSGNAGNALQIGTDGGAFYDETPIINAIQDNADAIALDNDQSASNEIQNLTLTGSVIGLTDTAGTIDIGPLLGAGGSDDQNIGPVTFDVATNELSIGIEGGNAATVSLAALAGGGGGNQNLSQVLAQGNDANAGGITNLTTDATDATAAATVGFVNNAIIGGGTPLEFDANVFDGNGSATTPYTIQPGGPDQILRTNAAGDAVAWVPLPTGGAAITDGTTITGDGSSATTALSLADNAVTLEKIAPNGATTTGQIIQWNTDADGNGNPGWEVADNAAGHTGNPRNVFFAAADGTPIDTEGNDVVGDPISLRDNGGFYWDKSKRANTGALFLGLKGAGNDQGTSVASDVSKLVVAERLPGTVSYPLQLVNEGNSTGTTSGLLFAANAAGNPGKGALVFERGATESVGSFHFLVSDSPVATKPELTETKLTIENDGDIVLTGNIYDKNDDPLNPTPVGHVLTNTINGTEWAPAGGLPNATQDGQVITWDEDAVSATPLVGAWVAGSGGSGETNTASNLGTAGVGPFISKNVADLRFKTINGLDTDIITVTDDPTNNEIDLDIKNASIPFSKLKPADPATPQVEQVLVSSADGTAISWQPRSTGGTNLATEDLTQDTGENRTYDLNGNQLVFEGSGNIGIGDFGTPTNPAAPYQKFHVLGEVRSQGFNSSFGTVDAPAFSFAAETTTTGDSDTGMWRDQADELVFSAGGEEILRLEENPGTPGTIDATVSGRLHVTSSLHDENDDNGNAGQVLSSTGNGVEWVNPAGGLIAKGRNTSGGTLDGEYTQTIPAQTDTDYAVSAIARQSTATQALLVVISDRNLASFSVRIYEIGPTGPVPVANAEWDYVVYKY